MTGFFFFYKTIFKCKCISYKTVMLHISPYRTGNVQLLAFWFGKSKPYCGLKGHSWGWMIEYAYLYHQYFSMINEKISLLSIHDKKINLGCFFMSINQIMTVMWTLDGCSIKSKLRFILRNGKRKLRILFIKANSSMNYAL